MPDRRRLITLYRSFIALLPVLILAAVLLIAGKLTWVMAVLILLAAIAGTAALIYRYENDLKEMWRDSQFRLQSAQNDLNAAHLLTNVVEGISDPLIVLDRKRQVVGANRAARELLGEGIVGKDIAFHLRHPDALAAIEKAARDGVASELEITLADSFDRDYLMRVNLSEAPMQVKDGKPENFIIISIYDVSKIKLAEKMRVDFVANASHELRTPLASLSGFIETLQDMGEKDKETRQKFLKIMESEASRMRRLIDDLLSLSRIEMDQHLQPSQSIAVTGILKSVGHALDLRLQGNNSKIIFDIEKDLPEVLGDNDQLQQVFTNLIDNAVKYGQSGNPIIVTARARDPLPGRSGAGITVSIFNSGEGIPAQHIPRLTERFYRVDAARSRQLGGTGLGLAIVKHIITRHKGTLNIESTPGHGTTVTVGLPQKPTS
jgi:two-component system phosphate regulon sensor histidine kinase PhoR